MSRSSGSRSWPALAAFAAGLLIVVSVLAAAGCRQEPAATPTPCPSPEATATPSPTACPTPGRSPTSTPVPTPTPTPSSGISYEVHASDTLYSISRTFGVTVEAIAAANGLEDPNTIFVGQVLIIPVAPTATPGIGYARVIQRVETSRKVVALTFDAAADAGYTAEILDTLKANGIVAGFAVTGRWAERNPDLVRRIALEGHRLLNHSYDHPSFTGYSTGEAALSQTERWEQLDRTDAVVQSLVGESTKPYFRPPYGDHDPSVNADLYARGYTDNVMWTVDSLGWAGLPASDIIQRSLSLAQPGAIYVFHVGSASEDAIALGSIIDGLRGMGYSMVSLAALLET